ncbi:MAG: glycosyltransferase family 4 protein [Bacteroidetes bacterium]|nr:glycosyltransferase family 4 protein [Bacteroidota bacterium]
METNAWISWVLASLALIVAELAYFKIADRLNVIDKPNERSSHTNPIIRGGGVIFLFGVLIWFFQSDLQWPWFVLGVMLIAMISFIDDVTSLHPLIRFLFHLTAVLLIFFQLWPLPWPAYLLLAAVIVCIGTLNAFNFMDGINGITGVYALVTLISFACIDRWVVQFTSTDLLALVVASVLIFLFFNFRKAALCFAGDVGSVTIAFILIFILLQLIRTTGNFLWPLFFLVHGTDSIVTIIYRLRRKENIFKAHRTHLYQYLSNEMKVPHLAVSSIYGIVQAMINAAVAVSLMQLNYALPLLITIGFVSIYLFVRVRVVSKIERRKTKMLKY